MYDKYRIKIKVGKEMTNIEKLKDALFSEAKDKIVELTLKYIECKKRLNKILSKMEGEQNA